MDTLALLTDIVGRHAPKDGFNPVPLPGVTLIRASSPTQPMPIIYQPTLCIIAQGRKRAVLGDAAFIYGPASYLMASVDLPIMGAVAEATPEHPYLCVQIDLDRDILSELVLRYPAAQGDMEEQVSGLAIRQTSPALLDATVRLASLLDTPEDIEAIAPLTVREILYRLLTGASGSTLRKMAQADSHLNQIARAILWFRTHFHESCPISEAAEVAGMSRSSFHAHFKAITSMSPLEFRTRLRLQEAQRLMVGDALDAASAGFKVGYESPSQFSRDYARTFGMPPARHCHQIRNASGTWYTSAIAG